MCRYYVCVCKSYGINALVLHSIALDTLQIRKHSTQTISGHRASSSVNLRSYFVNYNVIRVTFTDIKEIATRTAGYWGVKLLNIRKFKKIQVQRKQRKVFNTIEKVLFSLVMSRILIKKFLRMHCCKFTKLS